MSTGQESERCGSDHRHHDLLQDEVLLVAAQANASATRVDRGQLPRQTRPDRLVGQRLAGLRLCKSALDLVDEPLVVVQRTFERLVRQRLDRDAPAPGRGSESVLERLRQVQHHCFSVHTGSWSYSGTPASRKAGSRRQSAVSTTQCAQERIEDESKSLPTSSARNRRTK